MKKWEANCCNVFIYQYLISKELLEPSIAIAEFVELVRQYDTWEWDVNNNLQAKQLNTLFFLGSNNDSKEKMN